MWSVKKEPKPGFARISASFSSATGSVARVVLISMGRTLVHLSKVVAASHGGHGRPTEDGFLSHRRGCNPSYATGSPDVRGSIPCPSGHPTSDRVADVRRTPGGPGYSGGEVRDDGGVDGGGGGVVTHVVE